MNLYSDYVVSVIGSPAGDQTSGGRSLTLPRYGLSEFVQEHPAVNPTPGEQRILDRLGRGGAVLSGFAVRTSTSASRAAGPPSSNPSIVTCSGTSSFSMRSKTAWKFPSAPRLPRIWTPRTTTKTTTPSALFSQDDDDNETTGKAQEAGAASGVRDEKDFRDRAAAIYQSLQHDVP